MVKVTGKPVIEGVQAVMSVEVFEKISNDIIKNSAEMAIDFLEHSEDEIDQFCILAIEMLHQLQGSPDEKRKVLSHVVSPDHKLEGNENSIRSFRDGYAEYLEEEAEKTIKESYNEGYNEGYNDGIASR